jgi:hypothetical protein
LKVAQASILKNGAKKTEKIIVDLSTGKREISFATAIAKRLKIF